MPNTKKFLDANGVAYLASLLDNYPDNELLGTVIDAIQDALNNKVDIQKYGVCSTAADTAAKTVSIDGITELYTGLFIFVKFANANGVADPTLQVNNLTAKAIKRYGTTAPSTAAASSWNAGSVVLLIYDGTYWQMEEWNNTTYSSMTDAEITAGTGTSTRLITPARLKTAVQTWAPVQSVNGLTGNLVIDKVETTGSENNTEYNLISTAATNTNTSPVDIYQQDLLSFSKTSNGPGRLTIGSSSAPGEIRLYTSASSASGYTDLKSAASSTNIRTITFPDATGTVALLSDIPSISSWALASSKPSYTFSELTTTPTSLSGYGITDAYTKTEVDGMVSGVLHYKGTKATVSALPSSGNTIGDVWHITADGSEYAWDGSTWQELGTATDLSGYVPTSRTINGKALSSNISLTASDVSALPSSTTYVSSFNGETGAITYTAPVTSVNGQTGAVTVNESDEKVKYTPLQGTDTNSYGVLFAQNNGNTEQTTTVYTGRMRFTPSTATLNIYSSSGSRVGVLTPFKLGLKHSSSSYGGELVVTNLTAGRTYTLPDATGTVALTSDIPSVPSWALESTKPTYTASEVGAAASSHSHNEISTIISSHSYTVAKATTNSNYAELSYSDDYGGSLIQTKCRQIIITTDSIGPTFSNSLTISNGQISGLATPTADTMAATKEYVDNAVAGVTDTNTTYTLSISNNRITLTPSSGTASYVDLPVYDGSVT